MVSAEEGLTARQFLRVSKDRSGRERSNTEQDADNRASWPFTWVDPPYREVGSASKYAAKGRDEFPKLLDDLRGGSFGARVLVMWEGSRGSRRVGEWVDLIELCADVRVLIAVTEGHRLYDPANAYDRKALIDAASDAELEAAKISARCIRAADGQADAGGPNGICNFGYRRIFDPVTRERLRQEADPDEAPHVAELFERLAAGHTFKAIERDWAARGIRTRRGKLFRHGRLLAMARNPTYMGKRYHLASTDWRTMSAPERREAMKRKLTDAEWPAIVPKTRWDAVQRILNNDSRLSARFPGKAVHVFTMTTRCDICGGPMTVAMGARTSPVYKCRDKGCVVISKTAMEEVATAKLLEFLSRPDNVAHLLADPSTDEAVEKARLEVAEVRAELDDLYEQVALGPKRGGVTAALAARAEPGILRRLNEAEERHRRLSTPPELRGLIEPGTDVAQRWEQIPVKAKRKVVRILFSPEVMGELRIKRHGSGGRKPAAERMVWRTTEAADD